MPKHPPRPSHHHSHHHMPHHHRHPLHPHGSPSQQQLAAWTDAHGRTSERFELGVEQSGTQHTLTKVLQVEFATWLSRAMSMCPPEMLALFRLHVATIEHQMATLTQLGVPVPMFDPNDLVTGQASLEALGSVLSGTHQRHVLDDAMLGPIEVQAVAFVSLISLRLADLASTAPMTEEVENDG